MNNPIRLSRDIVGDYFRAFNRIILYKTKQNICYLNTKGIVFIKSIAMAVKKRIFVFILLLVLCAVRSYPVVLLDNITSLPSLESSNKQVKFLFLMLMNDKLRENLLSDLKESGSVNLTYRPDNTLAAIGDIRFGYDMNGLVSDVSDLRIQYDLEGRIASIGNQRVSYALGGKIDRIGDQRISYNLDGRISQIGDLYLRYDLDGKLSRVGEMRLNYNLDGKISRLGDEQIQYDLEGRVSKIGQARLDYDLDGRLRSVKGEIPHLAIFVSYLFAQQVNQGF